MLDPRRRRNLALGVASLGAAALLAAFLLVRGHGAGTFEILLGALGVNAALVGTVLAIVAHVRVTRRYDRLKRGDRVLARWRIDPARWQVFREAASALAQAPKALPNELKLPATIPANGIELIIAEDAFCLGAEFEPLQKNAFVRVIGPVLEIQQLIAANRSSRIVAYRLPVPEKADADVARLTQHFFRQAESSGRGVKRMAWAALVVAVAMLIWILIWAMSVGSR